MFFQEVPHPGTDQAQPSFSGQTVLGYKVTVMALVFTKKLRFINKLFINGLFY